MQGLAFFFLHQLKQNVLSKEEIEPGRLLAVRVKMYDFCFVFVNIYAPNGGSDRIKIFNKLQLFLRQQKEDDLIIMRGHWNCTLDFHVDRNGEEPCIKSSTLLSSIVKRFNLPDMWRENNPLIRQYIWVKINADRISAACLDRLYLSKNLRNRVVHTAIVPTPITDHKLVTVDCLLIFRRYKSVHWHFNVKLLQEKSFCENLETWKNEKHRYDNVILWWEIGKAHIREFCQQYTSHSTMCLKWILERLEKEILVTEKNMMDSNCVNVQEWTEKNQKLSSVLNEKVKSVTCENDFYC